MPLSNVARTELFAFPHVTPKNFGLPTHREMRTSPHNHAAFGCLRSHRELTNPLQLRRSLIPVLLWLRLIGLGDAAARERRLVCYNPSTGGGRWACRTSSQPIVAPNLSGARSAQTPNLRPRGVGGQSLRPVLSGGGGLGERVGRAVGGEPAQ